MPYDWQRFFAGIGGPGNVAAFDAKREQLKQEAQKTDYFRKLVAMENPDMADAVKIMGGPEVQAVHDSIVEQRLQKTRNLQNQIAQQQAHELIRQDVDRRQADLEAPQFANRMSEILSQSDQPPEKLLKSYLATAAEFPAGAMAFSQRNPVLTQLIRDRISPEGGAALGPLAEEAVPSNQGLRVLSKQGSKVWQVVPTIGQNIPGLPITSPTGENLGYGIQSGRNVLPLTATQTGELTAQQKMEATGKLRAAIHESRTRLTSFSSGDNAKQPLYQSLAADEQANLKALEDEYSRLTRPGVNRAAGAAPQTFTKGDRVRQNGTIYEYDGKNWNAVR